MNEVLRLTALFIRDLLDYDESLIKIGRQGDDIEDFTTDYIAVDILGQAQRLASGQSFDGDAESMQYAQQWQAPVTVSFYGNLAWSNATEFTLLIPSQASLELQESLGAGVYQVGGLTDVKLLTGVQYGNRIEATLNIQYSISADVDTKRIDTERIELQTERGEKEYVTWRI